MIWNPRKRRYEHDDGRPLTAAQIRAEIEDFIESEREEVDQEAQTLTPDENGIIKPALLAAFFLFLGNKIETWHTVAGTVAYGGEGEMNPERLGRIAEKVNSELEFLAGFEEAANALSQDAINARAQSYTDSAWATYENNVLAREQDEGVTHGRRVEVGDSETCPDCQEAATTEFIPLDEIVEIGDSVCLSRCRCYIEYDLSRVNSDLSNVDNFRLSNEGERVFR